MLYSHGALIGASTRLTAKWAVEPENQTRAKVVERCVYNVHDSDLRGGRQGFTCLGFQQTVVGGIPLARGLQYVERW